jgi:hypothetical protein
LAQDAKFAAVNIANIHKVNDKVMGKNSCQPKGLQPQRRARRSAEQGPRLRGCDREGAQVSRV